MRMRWSDWNDLKYDLADFFFGKQMDKAYKQGIRAGSEYAARNISNKIHNVDTKSMTKTQVIGHTAAVDAMIVAKKEIMRQTGAML